jgi:hypothetical protein
MLCGPGWREALRGMGVEKRGRRDGVHEVLRAGNGYQQKGNGSGSPGSYNRRRGVIRRYRKVPIEDGLKRSFGLIVRNPGRKLNRCR